MTVIVTGAAGFIGMHVAERLLERGETVIGVDNFNAYYEPAMKTARAARLEGRNGFRMVRMDIAEHEAMRRLIADSGADRVVHLAAQAGVRYSIDNPFAYERSNLMGHLSVLEACRHAGVKHLVYASSSSVYGDQPLDGAGFREDEPADRPVSLYAATKRSCELMSQSYATLYGLPQSALRFFTVYGPWGRPDMALFKFTKAMLEGQPIDVYGHGQMERDFTYVDDIVAGVIGALDRPAAVDPQWRADSPNPSTSGVAPWRVLNLGAGRREPLMRYIAVLEDALGVKATLNLMPIQDGDVSRTEADVTETRAALGYAPSTPIEIGVGRFVDWYRDFYGV